MGREKTRFALIFFNQRTVTYNFNYIWKKELSERLTNYIHFFESTTTPLSERPSAAIDEVFADYEYEYSSHMGKRAARTEKALREAASLWALERNRFRNHPSVRKTVIVITDGKTKDLTLLKKERAKFTRDVS